MTETQSMAESGRVGPMSGTSPLRPAPMGVTLKTKIERGDAYSAPEIYDLEITVRETLRGAGARKMLSDMGLDDASARGGFELVLTRISFGYHRRGRGFGDTPYTLEPGQFAAFSEDGKTTYARPSVIQKPSPGLEGEPFSPGQNREGWLLLQVPKEERRPLLAFNREYGEGVYGIWGSVWFQLY